MAQPLSLGPQLRLLDRIGVRGLDFLQLEAEEVQVALPCPFLPPDAQLLFQTDDLGMGHTVFAPPLQLTIAHKPIEGLELRPGQGQLAVLVLSVEGEQVRAERLQVEAEADRPPRKALVLPVGRPAARRPARCSPPERRSAISVSS